MVLCWWSLRWSSCRLFLVHIFWLLIVSTLLGFSLEHMRNTGHIDKSTSPPTQLTSRNSLIFFSATCGGGGFMATLGRRGERSAAGGVWSSAGGVWSATGGMRSATGGVELAGSGFGLDVCFLEGGLRCKRAGFGLVLPRCCRAGPSVVKLCFGRSTGKVHSSQPTGGAAAMWQLTDGTYIRFILRVRATHSLLLLLGRTALLLLNPECKVA